MSETISIVSEQKTPYFTAPKYVSIEAYYKAEEKSLTKNEYHDGIVLPMAGVKLRHNRLALKSAYLIESFLEEQNFDYIVSIVIQKFVSKILIKSFIPMLWLFARPLSIT
jgi:Uma2 family endonuclease